MVDRNRGWPSRENFCQVSEKRSRWRTAAPAGASAIFALLLAGCPKTTQNITVTNNGGSLTIGGTGFSNIPQCAQLALVGLPPPAAAVAMGQPNCSNGTFSNFTWRYSFTTVSGSPQSCEYTGPQNVTVTATDLSNSQVASQSISIVTGPNCAIVCGTIGTPACPQGCLVGVNSNPGNANGTCVACGGEAQPPCPNTACQPGLNLNATGGQNLCTASCGHAAGEPCPPGLNSQYCSGSPPVFATENACATQTQYQNQNYAVFACYDGSVIPANGTCVCQPANASGTCTSPLPPSNNAGTCLPGSGC